jgi:Fe-S cluster assembly protein SufB
MNTGTNTMEDLVNREYKYGFVTEIESDTVPRGLNEEVICLISAKKNEPDFMLEVAPEGLPSLGQAGEV